MANTIKRRKQLVGKSTVWSRKSEQKYTGVGKKMTV